ncbi:MAG: WYL domain-containing protein, partial [Lachnospiraceae bacterium]|nr:WYL domain-containing protein [Lachnospiraceae bacterium]
MAYSELIKNFEKIRSYMRDFYIYGFRTRTEFVRKSARSYDNERRRVESWLKGAVSFRQDASGKSV